MPRRSHRLLALFALAALLLQTFTSSATAGAAALAQADANAPASAVAAVLNSAGGSAGQAAQPLLRATPFKGDLRRLAPARTIRRELVAYETPQVALGMYDSGSAAPHGPRTPVSSLAPAPQQLSSPSPQAQAPAPVASFDGLDFATWGAGHPADANGDVGPTYYIQAINSAVGIYDKSTGAQVAAFSLNTLMSQGQFGNLCDTDNAGNPIVLYDTFEDRWVIADLAFQLDGSGNVINPPGAFECLAVSRTGDPVAGGWNFYSINTAGGLGDDPKLGIWPDGIYLSVNMKNYSASHTFLNPRVYAFNKAQMYAGIAAPQSVSFDAPSSDYSLLPSNARLQTGTPPPGTPNYFISSWQFLNALTVYKFHVDWDRISLSRFTGPDTPLAATSWPNATVPNAPSQGGNSLDVLQIRAMMQNQYSNIGGVESLWATHTVRRGSTTGFAAPRWYQVDVTGGTVAANIPQAATWDPDGANVMYRFIPSLAVDRVGDMALGYSTSSSTTKPAIKYAGRLASDPINTLSQAEQVLIQGAGTQVGTCGGATCIRWGDYSSMTLDPNGCTFWYTNQYYATDGLNYQTHIGSFSFPSCTNVGGGTLQGTVTSAGNPVAGAAIALGSRSTTTDTSGAYQFASLPSGAYPTLTVTKPGMISAAASAIAIADGSTTTQDFTLAAAPASGCFTDTAQADFQSGVPTNCDLNGSPGDITLLDAPNVDQQNTSLGTSGVGITATTWGGQTFTPSVTGQLIRADINLFCSGCTGTTPNLTLSVRATNGNLPTGADLATATIPGFSSGASTNYTANFASPATLTAGTKYALVIRPTANPSPGTYALTRSGTATAGADVYAGGTRVAGATSGTVWSIPLTGGVSTDAGFKAYIETGYASSGDFVSGMKDANPAAGEITSWTTLSWNASTPSGTAIRFQVAASNSQNGPFSFVGPDGTAATYFDTSGASLSQFDGNRFLKYRAYLSSTDSTLTPTLADVVVCFTNRATTSLAAATASGNFGGTTTISATLSAGGGDVSGKTISFTLNGTSAGSATTDSSGVATLNGASLAGISVNTYPGGVGASFVGDSSYIASSSSNTLTVQPAPSTTTVACPAGTTYDGTPQTPCSAGYTTTDGLSGSLAVSYSSNTNAGTATASASYAGDADHAGSSDVVTFTIEPASSTTTITCPASVTYTGAALAPCTAGVTGAGGLTQTLTVTYSNNTNVGTASASASYAGDANHTSSSDSTTFTIAPAPAATVTIAPAASQPNPATVAPLRFTVTFDQPVTGFGDQPTDLVFGGSAPGSLSAAVSGGPASYTVTVSGMTGPGSVVLSVAAGAAAGASGNLSAASGTASVTFAPSNPIVTGLLRRDPNPTNASTVSYQLTFSEAVAGVDTTSLQIASSGLAGAAIAGVAGSGTTYTVTVTTGSGDGTIQIALHDDDGIHSVATGIALGGAGLGNGDFAGEMYTLDHTPPAVTLDARPLMVMAGPPPTYTLALTITDNLAVQINSLAAVLRVSGPQGAPLPVTLLAITPAGDGTPRRATFAVTGPGGAWTPSTAGTYHVALIGGQLRDTAGNAAPAADLGEFVVRSTFRLYIPLATAMPPAPLPDLVVAGIRVTAGGVEVEVLNQGAAPVTEPFWVDAYLNPRRAPEKVNEIWQMLGDAGLVWGVTGVALPLAPGGRLTLRVGDGFYRPDLSAAPRTLAAGQPIYAQVDSANSATNYGAVLETHERDGGPYNNIAVTAVPAGSLSLPASANREPGRASQSAPPISTSGGSGRALPAR